MGLAASQARLLSLTARIHDVEYQAQMIQSAKMQLALQEDEVYRKYNEALDEQTLTYRTSSGNLVAANFNNLFGVDSITNGLNKDYTLWTADGELVVPDEVYEAYEQYGGNDPFEFAMMMVSDVESAELSNAENSFLATGILNESLPDSVKKQKDALDGLLPKILEASGKEVTDTAIENLSDGIFGCNGNVEGILNGYTPSDPAKLDEFKEIKKKFVSQYEQFRFSLYSKCKEQIFQSTVGHEESKLDSEKFNYYLRYARMIQEEGGITYVTHPSEFDTNLASDPGFFNEMLMSGKLLLDIVSVDKNTGEVQYDPTSAASDSNIAYSATSSVDSTALKKAEAEYEHAMKKIDQKDKQFDMDLNRLETERTALTTEYDSVKKVIQDNIERTFGIFS